MCGTDIFLAVLAVLFPPVAVWVKRGICSVDALINIGLCCLGLLPGLLHAWYIIWTYPDPGSEYERVAGSDAEGGQVTYYYVARGGPAPPPGAMPVRNQTKPGPRNSGRRGNEQYRSHGSPSYGATGMPGPQQHQQFPGQQSGTVPYAPPQKQQQRKGAPAAQGQAGDEGASGEGSSSQAPPPTYAEAVSGDHKIQTQE